MDGHAAALESHSAAYKSDRVPVGTPTAVTLDHARDEPPRDRRSKGHPP